MTTNQFWNMHTIPHTYVHPPEIVPAASARCAAPYSSHVLLTVDRDRTINYNGDEIRANTFQCDTCKAHWIAEASPAAKFCPACGVKFTDRDDVSV